MSRFVIKVPQQEVAKDAFARRNFGCAVPQDSGSSRSVGLDVDFQAYQESGLYLCLCIFSDWPFRFGRPCVAVSGPWPDGGVARYILKRSLGQVGMAFGSLRRRSTLRSED
jgi:hypothetical protein